MKTRSSILPSSSAQVLRSTAFWAIVLFLFVCLNKLLPAYEPFACSLLIALIFSGYNGFIASCAYLLSGTLPLDSGVMLCFAAQSLAAFIISALFYAKGTRPSMAFFALSLVFVLPYVIIYDVSYAVFAQPIFTKLIIAAVIVALGACFIPALKAIKNNRFQKPLSAEEGCSCALLSLCVLFGLYNFAGESVYFAIGLSVLLFVCYLIKSPSAFFVAAVLSLSLLLQTKSDGGVGVFVLACALLIPFSRGGKYVYALAAAIILSGWFIIFKTLNVYLNTGAVSLNSIFTLPVILKSLLPPLAFALAPQKLLVNISNRLSQYKKNPLAKSLVEYNRRYVSNRLYAASELFRDIGVSLDVLGKEEENERAAREALTRNLINALCEQCKRYDGGCTASKETYRGIEKLVEVGCAKGRVSLVDLSAEITSHCVNTNKLLYELNSRLKEYRRTLLEKQNLSCGREILRTSADGISELLKELAFSQGVSLIENSQTEKLLDRALRAAGLTCREIMVFGAENCAEGFAAGEENELSVNLIMRGEINAARLGEICSTALKNEMIVSERTVMDNGCVYYQIKRAPEYDACFGVATVSKNKEEKAGDSYSVIRVDEKSFLVVLSDGMGSGEKANALSDAATTLIEGFYKSKMASQIILPTVNKLLTFNKEESFVCCDIAAVNLVSGCADIIKIGSPFAFIISGDAINVIESDSLPLGILDSVRPFVCQKMLTDGDLLVLISDGVTSAFGSTSDLFEYLKSASTVNPQTFADKLVKRAVELSGGKPTDDITALAVKLIKKTAP